MKYLIILFLVVGLVGCGDHPFHTVIDNGNMKIYGKKVIDSGVGKYLYSVRDNSSKGWSFITDVDYNVGDTLAIVKARYEY